MLLCLTAACSVAPKTDSVVTAPQRAESAQLAPDQIVGEPMPAEERERVERRFRIAANETAQPSVAVSNDANNQDQEPAVTAINVSGVDKTAVAFIKITQNASPPNTARLYSTSTSNLSSFPTPQILPLPASSLPGVTYTNSADPYLATNPYSTLPGPYRTYLVGLVYTLTAGYDHPQGGVVVWRSDDGGSNWTGSTIVAEVALPRIYDKPAIAVSWNTASYDGHGPTVGNVYVAWCDVDRNNVTGNSRILFSRSTDGGLTWSAPLTIATGYVHAPQVVVPSNTGRIFVLYARYNATNTRNNSIEVQRSLDVGTTFAAIPTLTNTRMFGPGTDTINGGTDPSTGMPRNVGARSVFQARYNPWVGLQVVWHGEDPNNTAQADIYHATYGGTWTTTPITPSAAGDQWNPSFDYNNSGDAVVTWLDRRNDPSNLLYQPFYMKINTAGGTVQAAAALDASASNPGEYRLAGSVGEYNDTWFLNYTSGAKWVTAWPRIFSLNSGDIRATVITP